MKNGKTFESIVCQGLNRFRQFHLLVQYSTCLSDLHFNFKTCSSVLVPVVLLLVQEDLQWWGQLFVGHVCIPMVFLFSAGLLEGHWHTEWENMSNLFSPSQ